MTPFSTITELAQGLANKTYSAAELAQFFLSRINRSNLNAFITVTEDLAQATAIEADDRIGGGTAGPLTGIPLAHKDIFCTEGIATTCASRMLNSFVAPYDATVVSKLASAGAVCVGKTNMDEFAMGSSSETSHFGTVGNPWDSNLVPGGSSGGSACAVGAGLVPCATGSDTGGSIRQPAAFCGVTGLKPTYGRVSRYGMIAFASSLDQGGAFARSVDDIALLLNAMEGYDPRDSTSANHPPTKKFDPATPKTIGLPDQYWNGLDSSVDATLQDAVRELRLAGHKLKNISLKHTQAAIPTYYVIASAEASTNLSRYDGVRFGHRANAPTNLDDLYHRSRTEGFGAEVKRRILTGTYTLSIGYYDAYYLKAQRVRRLIRQDFMDAFKEVDVIATPVTPTPAFEAGTVIEPVDMYKQDIFTVPASLAGLPAISVPSGFVEELPVGLQLIAPHFEEARLFEIGSQFQRTTDWHTHHPQDPDHS